MHSVSVAPYVKKTKDFSNKRSALLTPSIVADEQEHIDTHAEEIALAASDAEGAGEAVAESEEAATA
jgi:hypothetical protein